MCIRDSGGVGIAKNVYIGAGLSVAGTLTYEDVTSVDSVGMVTAKSGLNVSGGQVTVGSGITMGIAGVSTFSGTSDVHLLDSVKLLVGDGSDIQLYHNGTHSYLDNAGSGNLYIRAGTDNSIWCEADGQVKLYHDNNAKFETTNDGCVTTGIGTFTDGLHSAGLLRERANVVANKLSAGTNIEMIYGNIHYYTTNETTTATPNIRYSASYSLNSKMGIGEAVTVTIIYKPNGAGYYAQVTVDGSAVTEEWQGGSAPAAANAGGYDVLTHTLVKTADATFLCLSNVQNFA